jgi:hypothetical protein
MISSVIPTSALHKSLQITNQILWKISRPNMPNNSKKFDHIFPFITFQCFNMSFFLEKSSMNIIHTHIFKWQFISLNSSERDSQAVRSTGELHLRRPEFNTRCSLIFSPLFFLSKWDGYPTYYNSYEHLTCSERTEQGLFVENNRQIQGIKEYFLRKGDTSSVLKKTLGPLEPKVTVPLVARFTK